MSSFPVRCKNFTYEIVKDFELSEFCKEKIAITVKELQGEIEDAQLGQWDATDRIQQLNDWFLIWT